MDNLLNLYEYAVICMKRQILKPTIIAVLLLLAAAVVSCTGRRQGGAEGSSVKVESDMPLLKAVPSDAVALMYFPSAAEGSKLLLDDTKAFRALVYEDESSPFREFLGESGLRNCQMAVSLHFNGEIEPLILTDVHRLDSLAIARTAAAADSAGLSHSLGAGEDGPVLLVSKSEALIASSVRHLEEGVSILSNEGFSQCLSAVPSRKSVLFLSNNYSSKLLSAFFARPVQKHASFLKTFSSWVVLAVDECSDARLSMSGTPSCSGNSMYYANVFKGLQAGESRFQNIVPASAVYALSIPVSDAGSFDKAYSDYLDASVKLTASQSNRSALAGAAGIAPDRWAGSIDIKEVSRAVWSDENGIWDALFYRSGRKSRGASGQIEPFKYQGFLEALYGGAFSLDDESCAVSVKDWTVVGGRGALESFLDITAGGDCLGALMADAFSANAIPAKGCGFVAYFSAGACAPDKVFGKALRSAVSSTLDGASFEPCVLSLEGGSLRLDVYRGAVLSRSASVTSPALEAEVDVPSGPFKVMNTGSGRTNIIVQQPNYYLSLKEEDGKGIWSVPFSGPLCGAVECIDYYKNGRLQFLFASGSSLHLLDRSGRFVGKFPVDLGKEIVLGPMVLDLEENNEYTVVVLHSDNTVGMYNLLGEAPASWLGITSEDKIMTLPELVRLQDKDCWAVRTVRQTLIFGFDGGEPLYVGKGGRTIRRDSEIVVSGSSSLKVTCNDGKIRNIKL